MGYPGGGWFFSDQNEFSHEPITKSNRVISSILVVVLAAAIYRVIYTQFFHPLRGFRGPWYATCSTFPLCLSEINGRQPEFFMNLTKKYGTDQPIRIAPGALFFPRPSALKDIYWDAKNNKKGEMYGAGVFKMPNLVLVENGDDHRAIRKALSGGPWGIGTLKRSWESRFDDQINLFTQKMNEHSQAKRTVNFGDKFGEFALDIMSMVSFSKPFGCVEKQQDVKQILKNWREALMVTGFMMRSHIFRDVILRIPGVSWVFDPKESEKGIGWLYGEACRRVVTRIEQSDKGELEGTSDLLQHAMEAKHADGTPLSLDQKKAHAFLLIIAGADTTATALGAILRLLLTHPEALARARSEIEAADKAGLLSSPIQYEETRAHLPFFIGCIKEGLRLYPSAPTLLTRVTPPEGRVIDGIFIPGGQEVSTYSYTVQRDPEMYGEYAEKFRPEMWMESEKRTFELEAAQATFGVGYRGCLGKDISLMELFKLLPEVVRRFDFELVTCLS